MLRTPMPTAGNNLLDQLPLDEFRSVLAACEPVNMPFGKISCEQDRIISHVYFPVTACFVSVAQVHKHPPFGMVLIGSEGMVGATLVLGVNVAPLRTFVQCPGTALRMDAKSFHECLRECPSLHPILACYLYELLEQLSLTAACTRFHDVETRLVRWLLLTQDRAHADHFHLTHQILADMLGVQRSAVTIAAGILQNRGLISYSRGDITVLNRAGLQAICCECYATANAGNKRLTA